MNIFLLYLYFQIIIIVTTINLTSNNIKIINIGLDIKYKYGQKASHSSGMARMVENKFLVLQLYGSSKCCRLILKTNNTTEQTFRC